MIKTQINRTLSKSGSTKHYKTQDKQNNGETKHYQNPDNLSTGEANIYYNPDKQNSSYQILSCSL
jgi:hypothetical protein